MPIGPAPAAPALPRTNADLRAVPAGQAVQVERVVSRDGLARFNGREFQLSSQLAGPTVTLRLDGHLITRIAGTGAAGNVGDGNPATEAELNTPFGVAATAYGGFLIADTSNNEVRKVAV